MTQQQSSKSKQSLKKSLVFTIMIAIFGGCIWLIFSPSESETKEEIGINSDIPDPRGAGIVEDKKTAYEQESMRQKQEQTIRSMQDYSKMLSADENSEEYQRQLRMAPVPPDYQESINESQGRSSAYTSRRGDTFQASGSAYAGITSTLGSFYEEPKVDPEKEELRGEIEELRKMVTQNQKSQIDDPVALLEKSFEFAAKYNQPPPPTEPQPEPSAGRKAKVESVTQVKTSVVSSLDRPMSDLEFLRQQSQHRNQGFNTVATAEARAQKNTISAVVHGTQVLVEGQSVRLRSTEQMRIGQQLIPRNTIITGMTKIMGERLEIGVTSIEYEGRIIPVEMSAYDSDGQQGIYIPGSMEVAALKEVAGNMGQNLGTTINLNQQSAGEQLVTELGRGAIQGTSQYIAKKARQIKVTLKSGYQMFLLPSEQY